MGICRHCKKEIVFVDGESKCPNCGKNPYKCWNCGSEIDGSEYECPSCHFLVCSNCNICGESCNIELYVKWINESKNYRETVLKILENIKSPKRKNCPDRNVSISYAKGHIRNMLLKSKGYHVKDGEDQRIFRERMQKIIGFELGYKWTITDEKDKGTYGKELRDASNWGVCSGFVKKIRAERKDGTKYDLFIREDNKLCDFMNKESLIVKKCEKCNTIYDGKVDYCLNQNCKYKKGKNKGELRKLVPRKSKIEFCMKPRIEFVETNEDEKEKQSD